MRGLAVSEREVRCAPGFAIQEFEVRKLIRWATLAVALGALAACGGGGGGGDGPEIEEQLAPAEASPTAATADVNVGNYAAEGEKLAPVVLNAAAGAQTIEGAFALGGGPANATVHGLVQRVLEQVRQVTTYREQAQKVDEETVQCDSGSVEVTYEYDDPNFITVGDKFTFVSNGCVIDGTPLTGAYSARFTRITADYDFALRLAFVNLSDGLVTLHGWADASVIFATTSVTYRGLTTTAEGVKSQWFHTVTAHNAGANLTLEGYVKLNGIAYFFDQITPFTVNTLSGYPTAGVLRVVDAQGDSLEVTALTDRFRFSFYEAGSDTPVGPTELLHTDL